MYFEVIRHRQSMNAGKGALWETYDVDRKTFHSVKEVKEWLHKEYFYCKTIHKMYQDDNEGKAVHAGYIYSLGKNKERGDEGKEYTWYGQDWVEVNKLTSEIVIVK